MKHWWVLLLILVQPLIYFNGLNGDFVFDDQFLIVDTMGQLTPQSIFLGGLWGDAPNQANFYRPLFSMTIWLDQQLFGFNSLGYHLHSLMWHMLNICLFATFASKVLAKNQATVATLVFGLHPLMSELVYWIAARNDTMAMAFALMFLNVFWRKMVLITPRQPCWKTVGILSLIFTAGMLSKESVLVLFVPVGLYTYKQKRGELIGVMLGIVCLLFLWRNQIGLSMPETHQDNIELFTNNLFAFTVDGLGRVLFPWRLSPATPIAWNSIVWWHGIFALGTLIILLNSIRNDDCRVWVLWFIASMILTLPAVLYTGNYGDRYWAMGLIAWSLLYAKAFPVLVSVLPLPVWMLIIFGRGFAWQSNLNFWEQEVQLNPTPYSYVSLAIIQYNEGNSEAAMNNFYVGFQADPPHLDGCVPFVSTVLSVQGQESALQASDWALSRGCTLDGEMMGLRAVIFVGLDRWDDAKSISEGNWIDSSRRLDVVRLALQARNQDWKSFCAGVDTWSDEHRLLKQLTILSAETFENTNGLDEFCLNVLIE